MREPIPSSLADDIKEGLNYFKRNGLRSVYAYMAFKRSGSSHPILVAFFRSFPGMTATMYSFFSAVEFIGRTIGSAVQYRIKVPKKKKFGFILFVYQAYAVMDMILLWIPYPLMLLNRGICGFLGNNSAIMREAAVQIYIPSKLRARVNALNNVLITFGSSVFSLLIGLLGEVLDYRLCMTIGGALTLAASTILIWGGRKDVRKIYELEDEQAVALPGV